jgi:hypothetical protein
LIATRIGFGAVIFPCQSGLARAGLAESALPAGVETGGLISLLADLGNDRLDTI